MQRKWSRAARLHLGGGALFVVLAIHARYDMLSADRPLLRLVRGAPDSGLATSMAAVTSLGGPDVLTAIVMATALGFLLLDNRRAASFVIVNGLLTWALNWLLKVSFARPRPELDLQLIPATGYSFPSGHAMASASVYGSVALVLALTFPRLRGFFWGTAIALALTVGASRVLLGVHYPSDVLAGWLLGVATVFWMLRGYGVDALLPNSGADNDG